MEAEACPSWHSSDSGVSCRICKYNGGSDLVASPCLCKGSMGAVHVSCLEQWLTGSARGACELCETPFDVVRTRRYGCLHSMWVFLRDNVNMVKFSRDLFFLTVSLMNATILFGMWAAHVYGELSALDGSPRPGLRHGPLQRLLYFLFFTLCLVFVSANAVDDAVGVFGAYGRRWYRWWQAAVDVRLVIKLEQEGGAKPKHE